MLVHLCTVESVNEELCNILPGQPGREAQVEGYRRMRGLLGEAEAAETAAKYIITDLKHK